MERQFCKINTGIRQFYDFLYFIIITYLVFVSDEMTGSSNDYGFAGTPQAKYSYVVELRDSGHFEFLIPPDQIRLSGEEGYDGVVALLDWIINNDY